LGARESVDEGLRIAADCGYGLYEIDLLLESARLNLLCGEPEAALQELCVALDDGVHPESTSGYPVFLAARDLDCCYAWGIAEGHHLRAQAFLLQAAQSSGSPGFAPADFERLPADVRKKIEAARQNLMECAKLRKKIHDPKAIETNQLLTDLERGTLTSLSLTKANLQSFREKCVMSTSQASTSNGKRFRVALSFPGERRSFVEQVATTLAEKIGQSSVLYDRYYEAEFAQADLDTYLQRLYHDESDLIVVFLCAEYDKKEWCGLEWRAIRDLIKKKEISAVMPLRFDDTEVPGLFSIDGCVWIEGRSPRDIADLILKRLAVNDGHFLASTGLAEPSSNVEKTSATSQSGSSSILGIWQKKLEFLQHEEAKAFDAAHKFKIQEDIAEARAKIREYRGRS
jgi:hypothetical protein